MPKQTFFNLPHVNIIRAAVEEFSKAPYQEISINHLIKCMEIPTGSFYQYFDDKRDLYFYILHYRWTRCWMNRPRWKTSGYSPSQNEKSTTPLFLPAPQINSHYQEIFVDNFNKAPRDLKREWTFDKLIGSKYMALYNYDLFDSSDIDPYIKKTNFDDGTGYVGLFYLAMFNAKEDEEKYK